MDLEQLIESHRPRPGTEDEPCAAGQLYQLNLHGLLEDALERQGDVDHGALGDYDKPLVITRQTGWETLSDAQRRGVILVSQGRRHERRKR